MYEPSRDEPAVPEATDTRGYRIGPWPPPASGTQPGVPPEPAPGRPVPSAPPASDYPVSGASYPVSGGSLDYRASDDYPVSGASMYPVSGASGPVSGPPPGYPSPEYPSSDYPVSAPAGGLGAARLGGGSDGRLGRHSWGGTAAPEPAAAWVPTPPDYQQGTQDEVTWGGGTPAAEEETVWGVRPPAAAGGPAPGVPVAGGPAPGVPVAGEAETRPVLGRTPRPAEPEAEALPQRGGRHLPDEPTGPFRAPAPEFRGDGYAPPRRARHAHPEPDDEEPTGRLRPSRPVPPAGFEQPASPGQPGTDTHWLNRAFPYRRETTAPAAPQQQPAAADRTWWPGATPQPAGAPPVPPMPAAPAPPAPADGEELTVILGERPARGAGAAAGRVAGPEPRGGHASGARPGPTDSGVTRGTWSGPANGGVARGARTAAATEPTRPPASPVPGNPAPEPPHRTATGPTAGGVTAAGTGAAGVTASGPGSAGVTEAGSGGAGSGAAGSGVTGMTSAGSGAGGVAGTGPAGAGPEPGPAAAGRTAPPPRAAASTEPRRLDAETVLAAVRDVPGLQAADLRTDSAGGRTLKLDVAEGSDPDEVSAAANRALRTRLGVDVQLAASVVPEDGEARRVVLAEGAPQRGEPRAIIERVQLATAGAECAVEVCLSSAGIRAVGRAGGPALDTYLLRVAAMAAADAIGVLAAGRARCVIEHVDLVTAGSSQVALVVLVLMAGDAAERLTGSALAGTDPRHAAVRATLAALNRRLAPLLAR